MSPFSSILSIQLDYSLAISNCCVELYSDVTMQFSIAFVMRSDDLISYSPTRQRSGFRSIF